MSVPSLSVSVHDRYGPEIRDKIGEKLREPLATEYVMLTPARLAALAEIESVHEPVISFYLELGPDRRLGGAWRTAFRSLAGAALKSIEHQSERRAIESAFDHIETALDDALPELGRGVVFFVCARPALWTQITLSLALPDGVHFGQRPHLRPLARTRDEHDCFVLGVLSQQMNRFFISQIGQVQEVLQVRSGPIRRMVVHRAPREGEGPQVTEAKKIETRIVAHAAEAILTRFGGRYLSLSGPPDLRSALLHELPRAIRDHDGGTFAVDVHANTSDVCAAAEPIQRAVEAREEVSTVRRLIDAGPHNAAWGVPATLAALHQHRVRTLIVDDTFSQRGVRCRICGCLFGAHIDRCVSCGGAAIEVIEDVVEFGLEQALQQKAALELVRSEAARRLMTRVDPMGAILRW
jgi:hypothetical protein